MKLFKGLSLTFILLAMVFALAACNSGDSQASGAAANGPVTIRIAHTEPSAGTINQACEKLKSWLEEKSDGKIKVELYPDGSISGSDADLAEAAATGTIEIAVSATSSLTNYSDKFGILDMPYLFNDEQCAFNAVDGKLGEALNATLEGKGLNILGYSFNGVREMTNNIRPITQPADFKGVKMRAMQSPAHIGMYKAFGANATPMSFGEVYTGLQQGTVNGEDNPVDVIYNQQFYEVQKYLSLTNHNYGFMAVVANDSWYNGLSEENRTLLDQGIKECMLNYERNLKDEEANTYIQKLKDQGMKVNEISEENRQKFVDAVQPLFKEYVSTFGQDLFDTAESYNK